MLQSTYCDMEIATIVDWIITERCNLNCYYCLQHADTRNVAVGEIDYRFIGRRSTPLLFHLTGGEPFLVPNFVALVNHIQDQGHYVSINTNLTINPDKFLQDAERGNIMFVNASYHHVYRKMHLVPFEKHYMKFREKGIFIYATMVMLPNVFDELSKTISALQDSGVCILPKLMRGTEGGKSYPDAYTESQKQHIGELVRRSISKLTDNERMQLQNACNHNVSIDDWLHGTHSTGTRCFDGTKYVRITETGDIQYCNGKILGNVYADGLRIIKRQNNCPNRTTNHLCIKQY